jgi:hypothetical protein
MTKPPIVGHVAVAALGRGVAGLTKAGVVARRQPGEGRARALAAFVKRPQAADAQIGAMFILRNRWQTRQRENI